MEIRLFESSVEGGNANELEKVIGSSKKSFLFFLRVGVRGTGSARDTDEVPVKRHGSCGVWSASNGP
jgi:hypothetical protein